MKPSSRHETALAAGEWTWTTAPTSGLDEYSASCMMFAVMLSDSLRISSGSTMSHSASPGVIKMPPSAERAEMWFCETVPG